MRSPFHEGELAVQARAGASRMAERVGSGIRATIPSAAQAFLLQQRLTVMAMLDEHGHAWASPLGGGPGFLRALDERTIAIAASPVPGDPLDEALSRGGAAGMICIDLAARKRMRANGRLAAAGERLLLHTEQVYANCPKYIQRRTLLDNMEDPSLPRLLSRTKMLSAQQRAAIAAADTFFIASVHTSGVDASHRGGNPGFVQVRGDSRLLFPDYAGNTMFQTLGNISTDPRVGLLFIDFDRGHSLQLTGRAEILWDAEHAAGFAGAERVVSVVLEEVVEMARPEVLGRLLEYSPFNPD